MQGPQSDRELLVADKAWVFFAWVTFRLSQPLVGATGGAVQLQLQFQFQFQSVQLRRFTGYWFLHYCTFHTFSLFKPFQPSQSGVLNSARRSGGDPVIRWGRSGHLLLIYILFTFLLCRARLLYWPSGAADILLLW